MSAATIHYSFVNAELIRPGIGNSSVRRPLARYPLRGRILVVETDAAFRNGLAKALREAGYEVLTATTGEQAFHLLRDWQHPIAWLYTRAALPGLIDGWILADQYRDNHPDRPAVIAARDARLSARGDLVLNEPTLVAAMAAIRHVTKSVRSQGPFEPAGATPQSLAA
jgi:CheY-like chemotaxis protein